MATKKSTCVLSTLEQCAGYAVRLIRVSSGMKQEHVAEDLTTRLGKHVDQSYISKIEKGHCRVSLWRLEGFCSVFGWKVSELLALAETLAADRLKSDRQMVQEGIEAVLEGVTPTTRARLLEKLERRVQEVENGREVIRS